MKKFLSLSVMLSLGLATVTPALNAAQSQAIAQSQANPAHVSGWQAAKKWWRSGRNMKALNRQEQRAFNVLKKKFTISAIITAIVALVGGGAAYRYRRSAGGAAGVFAGPSGVAVPPRQIGFAPQATGPVVAPAAADRLGQELIGAALRGDKMAVERLIAAGADVNVAVQAGFTALIYAVLKGYKDIVERLLDAGADVNATTQSGWTVLMWAATYGNADIVDRLLQEKGIELNTQDVAFAWTALMRAAWRGDADIVQKLLDEGADKDIQDRDGQTAESLARNDVIANMIRDYGKDK